MKRRVKPWGLFLKYQEISQWRARKFLFKLFVHDWDSDKKTYKTDKRLMFNLKRNKTIFFSRLILVMVFMGLFLFSSCKEDVFQNRPAICLDYPIAKYAIWKWMSVYFRNEFRSCYKGEKS
jgi:hypothetical protein